MEVTLVKPTGRSTRSRFTLRGKIWLPTRPFSLPLLFRSFRFSCLALAFIFLFVFYVLRLAIIPFSFPFPYPYSAESDFISLIDSLHTHTHSFCLLLVSFFSLFPLVAVCNLDEVSYRRSIPLIFLTLCCCLAPACRE